MASEKSFPSKQRETQRTLQEHTTGSPIGETKWGKDVKASIYAYEVSTGTISSSTDTTLEIMTHGANIGDIIEFTSGVLADKELYVIAVPDANNVEIHEKLVTQPSLSDAVRILRPRTPIVSSTGSLELTSTPIKFNLDGAEQEVTEDTATPSNNAPLPVKLTSATGDINITAGDLNVQTSHTGASFDSMRIGDGTETVEINASGEMQVRDDDANTALSSIDSKDFATQTTLAALLVELQSKADLTETQPVSLASQPLPVGAATEATLLDVETELQSLNAKDFATQTTLAALLTELQSKADLSETQPVSLASQPLPSGASTEAKQDSIITELQSLVSNQQLDVIEFARNDYTSTSVGTGAYVELVSSTSAEIKKIQIFDSSGQTLVIATGASSSEVDKLYVFPGGNGDIDVSIPASTRISIKAISDTANAGEISINFLG